MIKGNLLDLFNNATDKFYSREIENIISGISERNLCGRLANYIENCLPQFNLDDYFADTEYNRKQDGKIKTILDDKMNVIEITCDIILHSRGRYIDDDNLIAIEMKKSTHPESAKESDKNRLRALTKVDLRDTYSYDGKTHPEHVCGYKIGIYMELDIANRITYYELYKGGRNVSNWQTRF